MVRNAKSVANPSLGQSTGKRKTIKKRQRYSAKFKLGAVQMISATDPCFLVAQRLGLPLQTLHNWHVAYRDGTAAFSDVVRLTPEEKAWILETLEKRKSELSKRGVTTRNLSEITLLDGLHMKINSH